MESVVGVSNWAGSGGLGGVFRAGQGVDHGRPYVLCTLNSITILL